MSLNLHSENDIAKMARARYMFEFKQEAARLIEGGKAELP